MPGGFMPGANEPCPMPKLTYASASARCQASSPSDRPPASGRKSYWPGGKAFSSTTVFLASRSQTSRNVCSSLPGIDEYSPLKVGRIPRNKLTARPAPTLGAALQHSLSRKTATPDSITDYLAFRYSSRDGDRRKTLVRG